MKLPYHRNNTKLKRWTMYHCSLYTFIYLNIGLIELRTKSFKFLASSIRHEQEQWRIASWQLVCMRCSWYPTDSAGFWDSFRNYTPHLHLFIQQFDPEILQCARDRSVIREHKCVWFAYHKMQWTWLKLIAPVCWMLKKKNASEQDGTHISPR